MTETQTDVVHASSLTSEVKALVVGTLKSYQQPSAWELIKIVEASFGWQGRWAIRPALQELNSDKTLTSFLRRYVDSILESSDLAAALIGTDAPGKEIISSIDELLKQSSVYRNSKAFEEMIDFMGKFKAYAPYNNMLVRIQNPSCSLYATQRDWKKRFNRELIEDARPMLILAPKHPVLLVYELDQTEGPALLPERLKDFATFKGDWKPEWLKRTIENAATRDKIRVDFKTLSSTNAGFATLVPDGQEWKMRIAIHDGLDERGRFGVLCHELAHIYLGHLGADKEHWWPGRSNLTLQTIEIEAEAVAFIVTARRGLQGSSGAYVSGYLRGNPLPTSVSLDQIAKVARRIEEMSERKLSPRRTK
jgi:hypothetical protein